jgi:hypothetical protein
LDNGNVGHVNGDYLTSKIDVHFETLEQNHDDLKVIDEVMHGQKKMSNMMEEIWKFLKSSITNTLEFTSTSKGRKDIDIAKSNIGTMGGV